MRSRAPRARPRPRRLLSPRSPCLRAPRPTSRHAAVGRARGRRSRRAPGRPNASGWLPRTTRLPPGSMTRGEVGEMHLRARGLRVESREHERAERCRSDGREVVGRGVGPRISRPSRSADASRRRRGSAPYTSRPAETSWPTAHPPHSVCSTRPFTFRCSATTSAVGAGTGVGSIASSAFATARLAPGVACSTIETRRSSMRGTRSRSKKEERRRRRRRRRRKKKKKKRRRKELATRSRRSRAARQSQRR